jgi:hypothetical protein
MTVEEMERELIKLDEESRSRIYYFLIDLMDGNGTSDGLTEEEHDRLWAEECKRRCERFDKGETQSIPAAQVFAEARALLAERHLARYKELTA